MRRVLVVLVVLAAPATPALADDAFRASVRGFGGMTFMSETAGIFGAGLGIRIHEHVEMIGEVGRLTNVLPHELQRDLDDAARAFGTYFGAPLTIDGRAPGVYGFGGVRVSRQAGARLRIFAEAGGGTARGESRITAFAGSTNVSREVADALGLRKSETAGLIIAGGGVIVPLTRRIGLDLGYRVMRIFTDDPRINTAHLSAGIRWGL
jgi:opacity protein-like surface antigen